jgi:anti-anti-sigma factor
MKKQKMLFFKLKGELGFREVKELEKLVNKIKKDHAGMTFDLTNLSFIDSSGIGFIVSEYKNASVNKKNLRFIYKSEEIDVSDQTSLFKLCQSIISSKTLEVEKTLILSQAVNEKLSEILGESRDDKISVSFEKNPEKKIFKREKLTMESSKKEYSSNKIDFEELKGYSPEKTKEVTVFEKYKINLDPNKNQIFMSGIVFSFILAAASFLPDASASLKFTDALSSFAKLGANAKNAAFFISVFAGIICVLPVINIKQKSPFLLLCGILGIISLYARINTDTFLPNLFPHAFIFKKQFEMLFPAFLLWSVFLKNYGKSNITKPYNTLIIIGLVYTAAIYLIPFPEYKGLILSGIKTKSLLIESLVRVLDFSTQIGLLLYIQSLYCIIPLIASVVFSIFLFLKSGHKVSAMLSKVLILFYPVLFLAGSIFSGIIYKEKAVYHTSFYMISLCVYIYYIATGINYIVFEKSKRIKLFKSVIKNASQKNNNP